MKILLGSKDGGDASQVTCWGIESKRFGSLLILNFTENTREAYHTHAFNCVSWLLCGGLVEYLHRGPTLTHQGFLKTVRTYRDTFHKVRGINKRFNLVLSLRGPWCDRWIDQEGTSKNTLTHGRIVIQSERIAKD